MNYSIENLDVYRKAVATGAGLCRAAEGASRKGSPLLADQVQRQAFAVVTNLADGLGFWERELKVEHFVASKKAVLESLPLLEVMRGLGQLGADAHSGLAEELRDLAKMISGLLRGTRRREGGGKSGPGEGEQVRERGLTYH